MYILVIVGLLGFLMKTAEALEAMTVKEQHDHKNFKVLPQPPDCSNPRSDDRIVGGEFASLGQFPWLARIGYVLENCDYPSNKPLFNCAGALIAAKFVLTASHCIEVSLKLRCPESYKKEKMFPKVVRLGEYDQTTPIDCDSDICADSLQDINIKKASVHDNFDKYLITNDVALLELQEKAKITEWVNPVCLPTGKMMTKNFVGHKAQVAGWGRTGNTGAGDENSPNILKVVYLPIQELSKCKTHFSAMNPKGGQLCIGGESGQDSCTGDSGGPMMVVDTESGSPKEYLLGLVSYGYLECGADGVPAVYTDIRVYMKWILDHLHNN